MRRAHQLGIVVAVSVGAVFSLAACTSAPSPQPTATTSTSAALVPSPSSSAAPVYIADGTAAQNQAFFDFVNAGVVTTAAAANTPADGVAFISALRAGGFAVADMQVTPDVTTVGVKADSIQFSVAIAGQCLIGQYGFGHYASVVVPALGTGGCLIGETRPIDW
ncbi:DUF6993 domain-containing protein [Subtercola frigoramans]|uniref:DUF6993 domain-containing protein n=1 Tax=Subtercola frigoramans TaxID=120298 RepID=A0ABS2L6S3_9MICO|nr:hypothetical protein [Subtercola frigoramans]MBM7472762.1 hypothetical protein [Subtercola frigoramans]